MSKLKEEIAKAAARLQREKAANATDPKVAAKAEREAQKLTDRAAKEREGKS